MRIAIDLLWVRPGKNGGTESYVRNLLDGLSMTKINNKYVLLVSIDNYLSFEKYKKNSNFEIIICNLYSENKLQRVLWQNIKSEKLLLKKKIDLFFSPIYSMPMKKAKGIAYIAVIHDLQALHFPEYFSLIRNQYMYRNWKHTCKNADHIITISNFCKKDILKQFDLSPENITTIYNPICIDNDFVNIEEVEKKYSIIRNDFYYTVSALAKHKNLITILRAIETIKQDNRNVKLVVTGVNVNSAEDIKSYVKEHNLENNVVFTGYISNLERNTLYKYCKKFVFPSVFEGFGMPPVEAMAFGSEVITTKETSIPEVTGGLCTYVDNPYDIEEWKKNILEESNSLGNQNEINGLLSKYGCIKIAQEYEQVFEKIMIDG